jgi:signal transduction histidine kinase
MSKDKSSKRVDKLFSEIEQLASGTNGDDAQERPIPNTPASLLWEVESLRKRVKELETQLNDKNGKSRSTPIIYEKEEVGFAYAGNKVTPVKADQAQVQNEADVVRTPLTSGGRSIGEVQIAKPAERPLTDDDLKLANAIAQQASLQIENLRLLAATERARAEAEDATHQFTHQNWANFLDAIHNSERIGYVYDQSAVEPFSDSAPVQYDHEEVMQVLDQQIGRLFVKGSKALTDDDKSLINSIAKQVGQQVENIRLLADASRARAEAEEATRRLTRENWQTYSEREDAATGFVYDLNDVVPLGDAPMLKNLDLSKPLTVRGEVIGQLSVTGGKVVSSEEMQLFDAIARQTSIHLETLRLTEELQKRAEELKELDRLKSAFLANMSHELRTPLNSILGFTDVMLEGLDGPLTDYMNNDLRLIQKNGQHLLHLINDVLDMAKIESGRMNLHPEKFVLHELLNDVISITSSLAAEKNTRVVIEDDADKELEIYADNTRIRQVIINLVTNAVKFTFNGRVSMNISKPYGATALISVKDNGLGIPPDMLESIFDEFSQVDTSTTRKAGGTGLGLPISRRLIEMHGGRLWAESTGVEGEGSTFFVELPIEARITEVIEKQEK